MSRVLAGMVLAVGSCLGACHPLPPSPVPPDASDGGPYVVGDGALLEPPCQQACDVLSALCGPQGPACVRVYANIDGRQAKRKPQGGALTCEDVAVAKSADAIRALGIGCP